MGRPLRRLGLPQTHARKSRPESQENEYRLRRHLLLSPLRPRDASRRDYERSHYGCQQRTRYLRRHQPLPRTASPQGLRDSPLRRSPLPYPPGTLQYVRPPRRTARRLPRDSDAYRYGLRVRRRTYHFLTSSSRSPLRPLPQRDSRWLPHDARALPQARGPHPGSPRRYGQPQQDGCRERSVPRRHGAPVEPPEACHNVCPHRRFECRTARPQPPRPRRTCILLRTASRDRPHPRSCRADVVSPKYFLRGEKTSFPAPLFFHLSRPLIFSLSLCHQIVLCSVATIRLAHDVKVQTLFRVSPSTSHDHTPSTHLP